MEIKEIKIQNFTPTTQEIAEVQDIITGVGYDQFGRCDTLGALKIANKLIKLVECGKRQESFALASHLAALLSTVPPIIGVAVPLTDRKQLIDLIKSLKIKLTSFFGVPCCGDNNAEREFSFRHTGIQHYPNNSNLTILAATELDKIFTYIVIINMITTIVFNTQNVLIW